MPHSIDVLRDNLVFPATCAVCMGPATGTFDVQRTILYGSNNSQTIVLAVPMCAAHQFQAGQTNEAEQWAKRAAPFLGVGVGIVVTVGIFFNQQGSLIERLLPALLLGAVFFAFAWASIALWVAPMFVGSSSRQAREAVWVAGYWPDRGGILRLTFVSDDYAKQFVAANRDNVLKE